jgi:hypothetical protein
VTCHQLVGPSGALVAELPAFCPGHSASDGCEVKRHGLRARMQGPAHALVVAQCVEHARSFTLYPPGWAPYGRRPLCHVSPAGSPARSDSYASTLFGAVQDAASGVLWPRAGAAAHEAVHRTQGRHIELARELLGMGKSVGTRIREAIATTLGVPLLVLCEASRAFEQARPLPPDHRCGPASAYCAVPASAQRPVSPGVRRNTTGVFVAGTLALRAPSRGFLSRGVRSTT